jgi:HK97 family phage major capsid protein
MNNIKAREALERLQDDSGLVKLVCNETVELSETKDGDIIIEGWFVTETFIESYGLVVKASAFDHPNGLKLFNGRVMAFHNMQSEPVGKTTKFKIVRGKGLRGTCLIWKENNETLKRSIREGTLGMFSIGFAIDEYTYNKKTDIVTVTVGRLKEVSLVNIGADSHAVYEVQNADPVENKNENENKITDLAIRSDKLEKDKNENQFNAEKVLSEQERLTGEVSGLQNLYNEIRETQTKLSTDSITKTEFAERLESMAAELESVRTDLTAAKAAKSVNDSKLAFKDYRSLIKEFVWLTDDDGNKLGDVAQKAYCLFQMPVDYDKMEAGYELKNLRDLHDAVLISDAMMRYRNRSVYNIQKNKLFKQLVSAVGEFDADVALAMAGGNTGYGAEWLPSDMSSEFSEYLRKQPALANKFPLWNMPKGGSANYPFQNGKAVVYKGGEALVDNAEEARKTNIATGAKTFTPSLFIGALVASEELTEDTILDMISFIRGELATALLEGLESAIINGDDTTGAHFDNTDTTVYETYNVETSFKGLRKLATAKGRDIETSSSTTGVNALELVNFTDAKGDMGVAGLKPADCIYVTGIKGRTQVQQALYKEDALGVLAYMLSGVLPNIDGSEIYISGQFDEQLQSTGIRHNATDTKHTAMVCAHKPSFRVAARRGVTLEYNKNILTQQQQFVATARWDFGKICADAITPVVYMYNVQHTA